MDWPSRLSARDEWNRAFSKRNYSDNNCVSDKRLSNLDSPKSSAPTVEKKKSKFWQNAISYGLCAGSFIFQPFVFQDISQVKVVVKARQERKGRKLKSIKITWCSLIRVLNFPFNWDHWGSPGKIFSDVPLRFTLLLSCRKKRIMFQKTGKVF